MTSEATKEIFMINQMPDELTVFEKANSAARVSVQSVLELAQRTHTSVIVFRNGRIERVAPEAFVVSQGSDAPNLEQGDGSR